MKIKNYKFKNSANCLSCPIYCITHREYAESKDLFQQIKAFVAGGARVIQYRDKKVDDITFQKNAALFKEFLNKKNVLLVINDRIDIALSLGVAIHVGQDDLKAKKTDFFEIRREFQKKHRKDLVLGVSASSFLEAKKAQDIGADYLGVGAIFPTDTKQDANQIPQKDLKRILKEIPLPKVAIGGITPDNLSEIKKIGFDSAAMIRAICDPLRKGHGSFRDVSSGLSELINLWNSYDF